MCAIDDGERFEFCAHEIRTSRKPRRCGECGRAIRPGETYENARGKYENEFSTYITCAHCLRARRWLIRECNGWLYSGVYEDLFEHWNYEGIRTGELLRLIVGMRRKWQRFDGAGLLAVPEVAERAVPDAAV
jgi:hypothetical protein